MEIEVLNFTKSPEWTIYRAAAKCYGISPYETDENMNEFIRKRIKEGHHSILEHASITFEIDGISRACSHQLVRHRLASYTQQSQRYTELNRVNTKFIVPKTIIESNHLGSYYMLTEKIFDLYDTLIEDGVPKEDARYILPNAATTNIVVTMNLRELRHFFSVRCERHAQWEIREMATTMLKYSFELAPVVFDDLYRKFYLGEKNEDS